MATQDAKNQTSSRKEEHVVAVLTQDVGFRHKTTGLEEWEFVHNALPELNFEDIESTQTFLGKQIAVPFLISCMTGGYAGAEAINRALAEQCAEFSIAMGVGSQRQALESKEFHESFTIVRRVAPDIPLIANIGASHITGTGAITGIRAAIEMIAADALAVHLNPAQEIIQPEGTPRFKGVLDGIEQLCQTISVPVIVKEIGAGISHDVARRLVNVGVKYIDVAGAGGTSWTGVELARATSNGHGGSQRADMSPFWDWGIPTADSIRTVREVLKDGVVIGSGGITSGLEAAKAIALGADMAGAARPFLQAFDKGGPNGLHALLSSWVRQLHAAMFLTGSRTIADLKKANIIRTARHHTL